MAELKIISMDEVPVEEVGMALVSLYPIWKTDHYSR